MYFLLFCVHFSTAPVQMATDDAIDAASCACDTSDLVTGGPSAVLSGVIIPASVIFGNVICLE